MPNNKKKYKRDFLSPCNLMIFNFSEKVYIPIFFNNFNWKNRLFMSKNHLKSWYRANDQLKIINKA